jgi:hypothetical protein
MLLSKTEAETLTSPYHEVWVEAHKHAWALWQDRLVSDPEFFKPLTSAERYAIIHRHICDYVERHVDGDARIVTPPSLDFFAQVIQDRALMRFKHLDEEFKPRSYPTDQQKELSRQEFAERIVEQLALDGVSAPLTVLTVGYTLTVGEESLGQIVVVCRTPDIRYWYSIQGTAGTQTGDAEILPFPGMEPPLPRVISTRRREVEATSDEDDR